jgi:hypothetical protein
MSGDTRSRHSLRLMLLVSLAHKSSGQAVARPYPHRRIIAAGDDSLTVRAERHTGHRGVAGQRWPDLLAGVANSFKLWARRARNLGWWLVVQRKVGDQGRDLIGPFDLREVARPRQHLDGGLGHVGTDQFEPG